MMKVTPSHRRLTFVPLISEAPLKEYSMASQFLLNSWSTARRPAASARAEVPDASTPTDRPAIARASPRLTESKWAFSGRDSSIWWPKGADVVAS
jgi:hypothetical protein